MFRLWALVLLFATPAMAQDTVTTRSYPGSYGDATFAVENAIVNNGLKINNIAYIGEMLDRTGKDVGDTTPIFVDGNAQVFEFCSAVLSRAVMEADPSNIAQCPYTIFVYETKDGVTIGHRNYPAGAMQQVQTFLDKILDEALSG